MNNFNRDLAIYILDKTFYIALVLVGSCLIYKDGVIQRFQDQRTNFAVYSEPMHEMATLVFGMTNIPPDFTLREDFNISIGREASSLFRMRYGQNNIVGRSLVVGFEQIYQGTQPGLGPRMYLFKIRPSNLSPETTPDHFIALSPSQSTCTYVQKTIHFLTAKTNFMMVISQVLLLQTHRVTISG